ncbi:MAG: DUF5793 family protein [Halobacteriaceae archaeon]
MRREQLALEVNHVNWVKEDGDPQKPQVCIETNDEAASDLLEKRLSRPDGTLLDASETDVSYRLLDDIDAAKTNGVVSVTNRITGDFILELNEVADDVLTFIRAARRYGEAADGDGEYEVKITIDGAELVSYEKTTFLVYNEEGDLLRKHSLIPSGVEL